MDVSAVHVQGKLHAAVIKILKLHNLKEYTKLSVEPKFRITELNMWIKITDQSNQFFKAPIKIFGIKWALIALLVIYQLNHRRLWNKFRTTVERSGHNGGRTGEYGAGGG